MSGCSCTVTVWLWSSANLTVMEGPTTSKSGALQNCSQLPAIISLLIQFIAERIHPLVASKKVLLPQFIGLRRCSTDKHADTDLVGFRRRGQHDLAFNSEIVSQRFI